MSDIAFGYTYSRVHSKWGIVISFAVLCFGVWPTVSVHSI